MVVNNTILGVASSVAASNSDNSEVPRACLICRPNSHPFNDRTLSLESAVKVGRSVARARALPSNAIFDCKVLSRNHALLWYEAGKFYLQDTKSSNGTFVNNQRLSKGSEESAPREVCSGDILQFGVDVMENSRKVTHGCIIATLKLYLPDGKEAKASPTIVNSTNNSTMLSLSLPTQDLYQLNQYIQEALAREQLLETKLAVLQRLVGQTESASSDAWKSLIDEDRLLTRVEILESQLSTYGKSMNEDKLRDETKRLMEEKEEYQDRAKETLKRLVNEKLDAVKKLLDVEKALSNSEDELSQMKDMYEVNLEDKQNLATEVNRLNIELETAREDQEEKVSKDLEDNEELLEEELDQENKLENEESAAEAENCDLKQKLIAAATATITTNNAEEVEVEIEDDGHQDAYDDTNAEAHLDHIDQDMTSSTTTLDESYCESLSDENDFKKIECINEKMVATEMQLAEAEMNNNVLKDANGAINAELNVAQQQLCEALKLLDEKCRALEEIEVQKLATRAALGSSSEDVEIAKLLEEKETICGENESLRADLESQLAVIEEYEQKQMASSSTSTMVGSSIVNPHMLEKSLSEAEAKISELLKVKEKYGEVSAEKSSLALNMSEMQDEMNLMTLQTRTATACALIPLAVVIIAICVTYLPFVSNFFGTTDKV